jgi:serine/threonine protein kinase
MTGECVVKIADFGLQKSISEPLKTRYNGSPMYMAPELQKGTEAYDGQAADIFACGALLFVLRFNCFAFMASNDNQYKAFQKDAAKYVKGKKLHADKAFLDLIVGMTRLDPKERLSIQEIKEHAWM